jgi:hypothetical protein
VLDLGLSMVLALGSALGLAPRSPMVVAKKTFAPPMGPMHSKSHLIHGPFVSHEIQSLCNNVLFCPVGGQDLGILGLVFTVGSSSKAGKTSASPSIDLLPRSPSRRSCILDTP